MNKDRFAEILDAYGGDPLRWPPAERLAAQGFAARDPQAAALLAEAEAFDALLDLAPGHAPSPALAARILRRRPKRSLWAELFPDMPVWRPAVGVAAALALGFGVQSVAAEQFSASMSEDVAIVESDNGLAGLSGAVSIAEEDLL